jgi:uncharacterized protein (DUF1778 family)
MVTKREVFAVRLTPAERGTLERAAAARGKTLSECLRLAISFGLPLVENAHTLNLYRLIANVEYLQAAIETIVARDYPDAADRLLDLAVERVEQFHA